MKEDDRIIISWESTDITKYLIKVTPEKLSELTGVPVAVILGLDDPSDVEMLEEYVRGTMNLADELANVEDDAGEEWNEFTREDIVISLARRRD